MKIEIYNTNLYSISNIYYYDMMIDNNQCTLILHKAQQETILFYGMDSTKSINNSIKGSIKIPIILDFDPNNPTPTINKFNKLLILK